MLRCPREPGPHWPSLHFDFPFSSQVSSLASGSAAFAGIFQQRGMQPHQRRPPSPKRLCPHLHPHPHPALAGLPAQHSPLCQRPHPALPWHMGTAGSCKSSSLFLGINPKRGMFSAVSFSQEMESRNSKPKPQPAQREGTSLGSCPQRCHSCHHTLTLCRRSIQLAPAVRGKSQVVPLPLVGEEGAQLQVQEAPVSPASSAALIYTSQTHNLLPQHLVRVLN